MRDPQFIRVILLSIGKNCAGTFVSRGGHSSLPADKSFRDKNLQPTMPAKLCHPIFFFGLVLAHFLASAPVQHLRQKNMSRTVVPPANTSGTRESSAASHSTPKHLAQIVALSRLTQERGFASLLHLSTPGSSRTAG